MKRSKSSMALPALASVDDLQNAIKTEKNIMLVINELCEKLVPFQPGMERGNEIDLVPVAESLSQCGLSVKQTQRCWEQFKKRLRDVQKRESEFATATRMEVAQDFCHDQSSQFRRRLKVYERELTRAADRGPGNSANDGVLRGFEGCEAKTKRLIELFNDFITNQTKDEFVPKTVKQCFEELQEALRKSTSYME